MQEQKFFKKKQLLIERDTLLEEIGQHVFEHELPPEFANLPKEFKGMDIVMRKLKERARLFREERDRTILDLREVQDEMARVEKEYKREIEPMRKDCDAMALKLSYQREPGSAQTRAGEDVDLSQHYHQTRAAYETLQKAHQQRWSSLLERCEPLERHIYRLENAIFEAQEEMAGLGSTRTMRLRDLGSWYHRRNPKKLEFRDKYSQLKQLRQDIVEFRDADQQSRNESNDTPRKLTRKREQSPWIWPSVLLCLFIFVGYTFRTEYREDDLSFAWIADSFLAEQATYRVFGDFSQPTSPARGLNMPDLERIPGGETIFRAMRVEDIAQVLEGRTEPNGELLYFGVKFRRPPVRFGLRLNSAGWRNQSSILDRRALGKDGWVWLMLNERAFFLMRQEDQRSFAEHAKEGDRDSLLFLASPMTPISATRPLLQGYDSFRLDIRQDEFRLDFYAPQRPVDLFARQELLTELVSDPEDTIVREIDESSFRLTGPRSFLEGVALTPQALSTKVNSYLDHYLDAVPTSPMILDNRGNDLNAVGDHLQIYAGTEPPRLRADLALPGQLRDLAYQHRTRTLLVLLDGHLLRYVQTEKGLAFLDRMETGGNSLVPTGFAPTRLLVSPDENFAVLLEQGRREQAKARLLLLSLEDLQPRSLELLGDARNWEGACWDAVGSQFFLSYRKERVGKEGHVVAVYRLEQDHLVQTHLVELGTGSKRTILPDMVMHPTSAQLYMTSWPTEQVLRCDPAQEGSGDTQVLELHQRIGGLDATEIRGPGLALSRDGHYALVATTDDSGPGEAHRKILSLVEIGTERMASLATSDPGFSVSSIWRQPLSDRFWVLGVDSSQLRIVEIVDGHVFNRTPRQLAGLQPHVICSDTYGRTIFIGGPVRQ